MTSTGRAPLVGVVMGSRSDWETIEHAASVLTELGVPHVAGIGGHGYPVVGSIGA